MGGSLAEWQNPWLEKSFKAVVQRVPEADLRKYPAPSFAATVGDVPALQTIAAAPEADTVLSIDVQPEKRCAAVPSSGLGLGELCHQVGCELCD